MPLSIDEIRPIAIKEKDGKPRLFRNLGEETFQKILEHANIQNFESGQLIVGQGDTPKYLYLIIEGHIRTFRANSEGDEATIRMLNVGETCMEAVIFMGGPSPVSMQATEKSRLLRIPESFIKSLVLKDPQFANNLLQIVTHHYKDAMHQIDAMAIKTPVQRVGYYFLQKHIEHGSDNTAFDLPFKKATIASHLGMTPETFSRALSKIKTMGINVEGEKILMKDAYALCHFCDLDAAHECTLSTKEDCPSCPMHSQTAH